MNQNERHRRYSSLGANSGCHLKMLHESRQAGNQGAHKAQLTDWRLSKEGKVHKGEMSLVGGLFENLEDKWRTRYTGRYGKGTSVFIFWGVVFFVCFFRLPFCTCRKGGCDGGRSRCGLTTHSFNLSVYLILQRKAAYATILTAWMILFFKLVSNAKIALIRLFVDVTDVLCIFVLQRKRVI